METMAFVAITLAFATNAAIAAITGSRVACLYFKASRVGVLSIITSLSEIER